MDCNIDIQNKIMALRQRYEAVWSVVQEYGDDLPYIYEEELNRTYSAYKAILEKIK